MSTIDEIMKHAQMLSAQASEVTRKAIDENNERVKQMQERFSKLTDVGDGVQQEDEECNDITQPYVEQSEQVSDCAKVYNYIIVDNINGKSMTDFNVVQSEKRKGLIAPKVEIILLEAGHYDVTAHGKTYQTSPSVISADLEAGKYYCLGAAEDGLYIEERPYEWTL